MKYFRIVIVSLVVLLTIGTISVSAAVKNSVWDGSVRQVEDFLDQYLRDPDSRQDIEWSQVVDSPNGRAYMVRYEFRAKNGFGGYTVNNWVFFLPKTTEIVCTILDMNSGNIIYDCE